MDEHELRELIHHVAAGRLSRRRVIQALTALGLTGPMAAALLPAHDTARAQSPGVAAGPAGRGGGGGPLKLLYWQAPTGLNPHLAVGVKDLAAARLFYEPLAAFDPDGRLVPVLAAELPGPDNGGVARDGTWVTWRLKRGVSWHDGRPFTADDVVFTWQYAADPATAATTLGAYRDLERVERLADDAVKVIFKQPTPFWAQVFCGGGGLLLPRHHFDAYRGARSREAPANLRPVGTGPFRIVDFRPGDHVRGEVNPGYHVPGRPFFDTVELKGGGDAVGAARAVLQTGEYDFAWNVQVEDDVLRRLEQGGRGRVAIAPGSGIEHIRVNFSDPRREVDGERSSVRAPHPILSDPAVRAALGLLANRSVIQEQIYGRQARATGSFLNVPARFAAPGTRGEFSVERASETLEAAGWRRQGDGVRAREGRRLALLFQTSINAPRQKAQAIIKQTCARAGIDLELKSVLASVFFSADPGNPDTASRFEADLQIYAVLMGSPDPQRFMEQFASWRIASRENKWSGSNNTRWRSDEYDRAWRAAESEMDPARRAALFIRMNDLVVRAGVVVPLVLRNEVSAVGRALRGVEVSAWDGELWNVAAWHRQG
jgi:peptide/nickel transport system substrate-binding protein